MAQVIDPFDPGVDLLEGRALLQKGEAEKAKPFLVNALRTLNQKPNVAWGVALQSIAPTSKYDQRLFYDARLTNALCDEALALTLTEPVVELINDCAWFLLTTKTPRFHKPSKAIHWLALRWSRHGNSLKTKCRQRSCTRSQRPRRKRVVPTRPP